MKQEYNSGCVGCAAAMAAFAIRIVATAALVLAVIWLIGGIR